MAWISLAVLPAHGIDPGRYGMANGDCAIGSKLYVVGGINQSLGTDDWLDIYDDTTDTWSSGAVYPLGGIAAAACAAVGGLLYVAGGVVAGAGTDAGRVYTPGSDSWAAIAVMPGPRVGNAGVALGGFFYSIGGEDSSIGGSPTTADVYRYNPGTNTWATMASLPSARSGAAAAAIGGYIYVAGGDDSAGNPTDTLYRYDVAGNSWTAMAPMPAARSGQFVGALNGRLHVVGGSDAFPSVRSHYRYDPATDSWLTKTMPASFGGRHDGAWGVINNRLHVVGGFRSGSDFREEHNAFSDRSGILVGSVAL